MSGDLSLTSATASWLESEIVSIMSVRRLKALYIISQTLIAVNLIELNIDGLCLNIKFSLPPPPPPMYHLNFYFRIEINQLYKRDDW